MNKIQLTLLQQLMDAALQLKDRRDWKSIEEVEQHINHMLEIIMEMENEEATKTDTH